MWRAVDVELRPRATGGDKPCSDVLIAGRPADSPVSGSVLEAAVRWSLGWLLFVTDDTPSEEVLAIHLLDNKGRLLDSAYVGGPYTTGTFSDLRLEPPATVHFRFIDDADWSVRLLDKPKRALPWWPDARGVWRGARLARYFQVHRR